MRADFFNRFSVRFGCKAAASDPIKRRASMVLLLPPLFSPTKIVRSFTKQICSSSNERKLLSLSLSRSIGPPFQALKNICCHPYPHSSRIISGVGFRGAQRALAQIAQYDDVRTDHAGDHQDSAEQSHRSDAPGPQGAANSRQVSG